MLAAAAGAGVGAGLDRALSGGSGQSEQSPAGEESVPFYGPHQAGVATAPQNHIQLAAFDHIDPSAAALRRLLERWSHAAAVLTAGRPYEPMHHSRATVSGDPGEATGLSAARLTLTFGFGPSLFDRAAPRSLAGQRPPQLEPLPPFAGDQLDPSRSGGDLCVQACADDPQVAFHAVHVLSMLADPTAAPRWTHDGFRRPPKSGGGRPRNLIGFKDGTDNIRTEDAGAMETFVWVQPSDGTTWMSGGTYLIVRRIAIQFPSWDQLSLEQQEHTIGRHKLSGAPLGAGRETDPVDLSLRSGDGAPMIPEHAHIRQASPASNEGQRILRRSYNFSGGGDYRGEIGAGRLDGGLLFIAFARNPARQFVPLQRRLSTGDALSAFTLHTASAVFACPPGAQPGGFVGQRLFS